MTEKRFHKGDWSNSICEVYDGEEYIGGVQLNCADEFIDLLNELYEENKALKQLICDNYDEELCNLCKHQYIVPHKVMQGYYMSKCKKGYEECGKGTVYCCNDFEFKELQE